MSTEDKVSINAKHIILSIVAASTAIAALGMFAPSATIAEKIAIPFITGVIGFGAGIVSQLWGK